MAFVPILIAAATVAASATAAYGQMQTAHAEADSAKFNQGLDVENAAVARQNANISAQSGEAQAGTSEQKSRAIVGGTTANQAAGNLDLYGKDSSQTAVRGSERVVGSLDAATVRSNASKEAFGYQVQESNLKAEAALEGQEAGYDITAGNTGAAGTLLGGISTAGSQYAQYQMNNGVNNT